MYIGGLQKFSLLDYPEHLAAIIFTQGCNFRCPFCYNPMLVRPVGEFNNTSSASIIGGNQEDRLINEAGLFDWLRERYGKLDAVVITGGEPTLHRDLPDFIKKIRAIGYKVKLDTNGSNPEMLKKLIGARLIDYVAMDVKAPPDKYDLVSGAQPDLNKIKASVNIIMASGRPYEFRTTIVPELLNPKDIEKIGEMIKGAEKWFLQQFKSDQKLVNKSLEKASPYPLETLEKMREIAGRFVKYSEVR